MANVWRLCRAVEVASVGVAVVAGDVVGPIERKMAPRGALDVTYRWAFAW